MGVFIARKEEKSRDPLFQERKSSGTFVHPASHDPADRVLDSAGTPFRSVEFYGLGYDV